jgi:hypothetical protein
LTVGDGLPEGGDHGIVASARHRDDGGRARFMKRLMFAQTPMAICQGCMVILGRKPLWL